MTVMTTRKTFATLALVPSLLSCSMEKAECVFPKEMTTVCITAVHEADITPPSRVFLNDYALGTLSWDAKDSVAAFVSGDIYKLTNSLGEDGPTAKFTGAIPSGSSIDAILYPFSSDASKSGNNYSAVIPSSQKALKNGIDPSALAAISFRSEDGIFHFKNAFGLVVFTIPESASDITSVTIEGNGGEKISGKAIIGADGSGAVTVTPSADALNFASLKPSGSETFQPGNYAIAIIPSDFPSGIRFILKHSSGVKGAVRGTTTAYSIVRNGSANFGTSVFTDLDSDDFKYYYLYSKEDLDKWTKDNGNWKSTDKVFLGCDIDYGKGTFKKYDGDFSGTFDGQYHRIYNIRTVGSTQRAGFFHKLSGTVKNVCFGSSNYDFSKGAAEDAGTYDNVSFIGINGCGVEKGWYYAGPVAYLNENGVMENVVNFCNVYSSVTETSSSHKASYHRIGGIAGTMKKNTAIRNCVNYGSVMNSTTVATGTTNDIGGIVSRTDENGGIISNCTNWGDVTNSSPYVYRIGGILGAAGYATTVEKCHNYGKITNKADVTDIYLGGIIGETKKDISISACTSDCIIADQSTSKVHSGIIAGCITAPSITSCGLRGNDCGNILDSDNWKDHIVGTVTDASKIITDGSANSCHFIGTPTKTKAVLKIGTFNVYSPNARKSDKVAAGRMWPSAIEGLARTIVGMDCDIIGFNELRNTVWHHPDVEDGHQLKDRVNELNGNKYVWKWEYPNFNDGSSDFCNGFAYDPDVVSLISEPVCMWLASDATTCLDKKDGGRTIVYAHFKHLETGKTFWFASTHITLSDDKQQSQYNAACCVNLAKSVVDHKETCFLAGDMNCASKSIRPATYEILLGYWGDAYASAKEHGILNDENLAKPATRPGTGKDGTGTAAELKELQYEYYRYDHIMFDKAKVTGYNCIRDFYPGVDGIGYWPSDHFPIWAEFEF